MADARAGSEGLTAEATAAVQEGSSGDQRLAILLAMAMFVLVVDTSLMNVSISAVVHDLDTTASGVQSAIALEALVSAAFILIGSKIGDLIGRKRAYVLGLLGYAAGALSMTLSQSLVPIIIFWAIVGGLGASLLLPSMQSLIHGNFEGAMQRRAYALVGASAAIAAAVGPLVGGFITTYLSWRIAFLGEVVIIGIVLSGIKLVHDVPYTGSPGVDVVGAILSALGMGGVVLGILVWEEGGGAVGALIAVGVVGLVSLAWWLKRRKREGKPALLDVGLFRSKYFRLGITSQTLQQIALGGLMISLPIFLQMVLEYDAMEAGLSLAPLSLSMFAVALLAAKRAGRRSASKIILVGFLLLSVGVAVLIPVVPRADSGWAMFAPLLVAGAGLGLLVSQLNNYTLSPIEEERVSEAAGVNSAGGSFGLSFGLAFAGAIMLGSLSLVFTQLADDSKVLSPAQQDRVAKGLEENAEVMTNTHLEELLAGQPADVKAEIIDINTDARPIALQIALLIPLFAALLGLVNGYRMTRLPDPKPSAAAEGVLGG
jgi:EmrB/QacA subfamily drug resistance transporter